MEVINVRSVYGGKTYTLTFKDKTGHYLDLQCSMEELYDHKSGDPINERVKEMDDCILKEWNPDKFQKLFYELNPDTDFRFI